MKGWKNKWKNSKGRRSFDVGGQGWRKLLGFVDGWRLG